jgi:predicted metallopeptidase
MTTLNLTAELERLVADIVSRVEELRHIDPQRVLVCVSSTRSGGIHGTYAKIHPLRFPGGERNREVMRGAGRLTCTMPTITHRDTEMLYVIYFLVPRFLNLTLQEKLITVFHELYHISPAFDGDIRRFAGKNFAHGSSRKRFDALVAALVDDYLGKLPDSQLISFLNGNMEDIRARHSAIVARKMPAPRISVAKQAISERR